MNKRLLILEDCPFIALDLANLVMEFGYDVAPACHDAGTALRAVATEKLDAALIDYRLAEGTSEVVAAALGARSIAFAICTGLPYEEIKARYPEAPVLSKPYRAEEVQNVLSQLNADKDLAQPPAVGAAPRLEDWTA